MFLLWQLHSTRFFMREQNRLSHDSSKTQQWITQASSNYALFCFLCFGPCCLVYAFKQFVFRTDFRFQLFCLVYFWFLVGVFTQQSMNKFTFPITLSLSLFRDFFSLWQPCFQGLRSCRLSVTPFLASAIQLSISV